MLPGPLLTVPMGGKRTHSWAVAAARRTPTDSANACTAWAGSLVRPPGRLCSLRGVRPGLAAHQPGDPEPLLHSPWASAGRGLRVLPAPVLGQFWKRGLPLSKVLAPCLGGALGLKPGVQGASQRQARDLRVPPCVCGLGRLWPLPALVSAGDGWLCAAGQPW